MDLQSQRYDWTNLESCVHLSSPNPSCSEFPAIDVTYSAILSMTEILSHTNKCANPQMNTQPEDNFTNGSLKSSSLGTNALNVYDIDLKAVTFNFLDELPILSPIVVDDFLQDVSPPVPNTYNMSQINGAKSSETEGSLIDSTIQQSIDLCFKEGIEDIIINGYSFLTDLENIPDSTYPVSISQNNPENFIQANDKALDASKENKQRKCNECGKTFRNVIGLHRHQKCCGERSKRYCTICERYFTSMRSYRRHMTKQHESSNECPICKAVFLTRHTMVNHLRKEHPSKPSSTVICHLCFESFPTNYQRKKHRQNCPKGL